jgi:hypothetical protein
VGALDEAVELGVEVVEALGEEFGFLLDGGDAALEGADGFVDFLAGGGGEAEVLGVLEVVVGGEGVEAEAEGAEVVAGGVFLVEGGHGVGGAEVGLPEVEAGFGGDEEGGGDDEVLVILDGIGVGEGGEHGSRKG